VSRLKRFATGVLSGYAAIIANVLYTLCSIPLALHFLSRAEFGLWSLVTQIATYLLLLDLGMAGSISRILIDHKDNIADGNYGAVIKTGALVLMVQGALIAIGGILLTFGLVSLLEIPLNFARDFKFLLAGQCIALGVFFVTRMSLHILNAHQRYDFGNYGQIAYFAANLVAMWIGFRAGLGLYAMLLGNVAAMFCSSALLMGAVRALNLFPAREAWGTASWPVFRQLFAFSNELFLLSLGQQLVNGSQALVITRTLGLDAVTVWSVAMKAFSLAQQFIWRLWDYSAGAIAEMIVRAERDRMRQRFRQIFVITASLSVLTATAIAVCNSDFLAIWTRHRIAWSRTNDFLCAALLVVNCVTRLHVGLLGPTKKIGRMRYIYFLEGVSFVILGLLVGRQWGIGGILVAAIVMNIFWTGIYGILRTAREFNVNAREIIIDWQKVPARFASVLIPLAFVTAWFTHSLPNGTRLAVNAITIGIVGTGLLWKLGLTDELRREAMERLSKLRRRID
jgi:O-antigen/teichoic acid export membrane protein